MASPPIQCAECGTLLYIPCPGSGAGSVDFRNPIRLTVEQMIITNMVCFSATCPTHSKVIDLGPFESMEQIFEQPSDQHVEQSDSFTAIDTDMVIDGQQAHLNDESPLQEQQKLWYNVLIKKTKDMIEHVGKNPCRFCYQAGRRCRWEPNEENCEICRSRVDRPSCNKSLFRAIPAGPWVNKIIHDHAPHCSIHASAFRQTGAAKDRSYALHYQVKWPFKRIKTWDLADLLKDYPDILKSFHLANPRSPGPADWLVDGDAEFSRLMAVARVDLREG